MTFLPSPNSRRQDDVNMGDQLTNASNLDIIPKGKQDDRVRIK